MSNEWDGVERRKVERRKTKPWDWKVRIEDGTFLDLRKVLPLRVSDWKVLKKSGITMQALSGMITDMDLDQLQTLLAHVAKKVHPEITPSSFDSLTMLELVGTINGVLNSESQEVDRPT